MSESYKTNGSSEHPPQREELSEKLAAYSLLAKYAGHIELSDHLATLADKATDRVSPGRLHDIFESEVRKHEFAFLEASRLKLPSSVQLQAGGARCIAEAAQNTVTMLFPKHSTSA
jgi:hypothetical protein